MSGLQQDFRISEVAIALLVAVFIQLATFLAMSAATRAEPASSLLVDSPTSLPVKIVPVLDAPILAFGGKRDQTKLPDRWVPPQARKRFEDRTFVSPKAGKTIADIPDTAPLADAKTPVPPPDAEKAKEVEAPIVIDADAGPPANIDREGHADGSLSGTEKDPLKARAVDLYRDRIRSWFSRRFRVSGSGLGAEEITKYRVSATISISTDRTVTSYDIVPSGHDAFDRAARVALDGAKGEAIPPPPENYPDIVQTRISLTFTCTPERCD